MNLDEMKLSSPNYPKWYNFDDVGCEWLISAQEGFIIALEFNHFHVSNLVLYINILWCGGLLSVTDKTSIPGYDWR